jgi:hypothetical protein
MLTLPGGPSAAPEAGGLRLCLLLLPAEGSAPGTTIAGGGLGRSAAGLCSEGMRVTLKGRGAGAVEDAAGGFVVWAVSPAADAAGGAGSLDLAVGVHAALIVLPGLVLAGVGAAAGAVMRRCCPPGGAAATPFPCCAAGVGAGAADAACISEAGLSLGAMLEHSRGMEASSTSVARFGALLEPVMMVLPIASWLRSLLLRLCLRLPAAETITTVYSSGMIMVYSWPSSELPCSALKLWL